MHIDDVNKSHIKLFSSANVRGVIAKKAIDS